MAIGWNPRIVQIKIHKTFLCQVPILRYRDSQKRRLSVIQINKKDNLELPNEHNKKNIELLGNYSQASHLKRSRMKRRLLLFFGSGIFFWKESKRRDDTYKLHKITCKLSISSWRTLTRFESCWFLKLSNCDV